jgi:hypothetical protein
MRQYSENGFDIVRDINRSKILYITSELVKKGFVIEKGEKNDWKDGVLVYEKGSGNIYIANSLSRIKDGNVEYLDLFELTPANNTGLQRVYTEIPWEFSTYQIIKEGKTPEQVLAEIKLLEKEHKDSIAQSISDDITSRDFNDMEDDDE